MSQMSIFKSRRLRIKPWGRNMLHLRKSYKYDVPNSLLQICKTTSNKSERLLAKIIHGNKSKSWFIQSKVLDKLIIIAPTMGPPSTQALKYFNHRQQAVL